MIRHGVLILYNEPRGDSPVGAGVRTESEAGVLKEVEAVAAALRELGVPHRRVGVRSLREVGDVLLASGETRVFNLVEGLDHPRDACLVPAICGAFGKAWTGNGTACQLLALDKWQAKCALRAAGVPVPDGAVILPGAELTKAAVPRGPVIVKPLGSDASEGIDGDSVLTKPTPAEIAQRAARIHGQFAGAALVESYVEGREFNVSLIERAGEVVPLPLAEIDFTGFPPSKARIVDYAAKWLEDSMEFRNTPRRVPADVDETTAARIRSCAVQAWHCLGCRDYARVDLRLDAAGDPFVIEVNPNPDISPDAGFCAALQAAGIPFAEFVRMLTVDRPTAGQRAASGAADAAARPKEAGLHVRRSQAGDEPEIVRLVGASGVFRPCEIEVAREVVGDAVKSGEHGPYQSYTAVLDGRVVGWTCFGATPCTEGTFDLYWLAVDAGSRRRGIAAALSRLVEEQVRARGGRMIVAETSSRQDYEPARRLYESLGFRRECAVTGFYDTGDDKIIYTKPVPAAPDSTRRAQAA